MTSRTLGVTSFFWTIADFCEQELLPFLFADAEDDRQQYTMVVANVTAELRRAARIGADPRSGTVTIEGKLIASFEDLVTFIESRVLDDDGPGPWAGRAIGMGTINAFVRRLYGAIRHLTPLIRSDVANPDEHRVKLDHQVTVVDIHNLNDRAKRFVVGVILRKAFDDKERSGTSRPLLFVVLDELEQVRAARRVEPDQGDLVGRRRAGPLARHHPHRRAADGQRGRTARHRELGDTGRRPPRFRRSITGRIRLLAHRAAPTGDAHQAGHDDREPTRVADPARARVPLPRRGPPAVPKPAPTRPRSDCPPIRSRDCRSEDPAHRRLACRPRHPWAIARGRAPRRCWRRSPRSPQRERVDAVLVVGDLFDTATPTAESEKIVYAALLALAQTGATVVVLAGNHDSDRRLQAVAPLLELGHVVTRPVFASPDAGGVVELRSRDGRERALLACVPFLSQRWVVKAHDLLDHDAATHQLQYSERMRMLVRALTAGFTDPDTIHLLAAHCMVWGAATTGSERMGQTIFEYSLTAHAFPPSLQYVALGHLHRQQQVHGPVPIYYPGSPLQLDFGEWKDEKGVLIIDVHAGKPTVVRPVALTAGRRLRVIDAPLLALSASTLDTGDDWLKVIINEKTRPGLADEVRALLPNAVDVVVASAATADRPERTKRTGRSPHELFAEFLADRSIDDDKLAPMFAELLDAVMEPS